MAAVVPLEVRKELREVGLRFSTDQLPGCSRRRTGRGFAFFDAHGRRITEAGELERIRALVIPPAWSQVWISPNPNGHLQATGRDAKGRKQAIYHPEWRAHRDSAKFERMREFGLALPRLRKRIEKDLARRGLHRDRVLAAVVRLLERTLIRIGNREYARANASFGLTTMRNEHLELGGEKLRFTFRGKSGKEFDVTYRDRRISALIRRVQELPGQTLFQYLSALGRPVQVTSSDVNAYLREAMGEDFTAKDFRTWMATVEAVRLGRELAADGPPRGLTQQEVVQVVKSVAHRLGNTAAVCRQSYIPPDVLEGLVKGEAWLRGKLPRATRYLDSYERLTLQRVL